jgi:hypothetical protein
MADRDEEEDAADIAKGVGWYNVLLPLFLESK